MFNFKKKSKTNMLDKENEIHKKEELQKIETEKKRNLIQSLEELKEESQKNYWHTTKIVNNVQNMAQTASEHNTIAESSLEMMNEMVKGIENVSNSSKEVKKSSSEVIEETRKGRSLLESAVQQINHIGLSVSETTDASKELEEKTKEIEKIVEVISGISSQINLLALNASIEAARAGEHGKGFAVVAQEVKKLAEKSSKSAEQINKLVSDIKTQTNVTNALMDKVTENVEKGMEITMNTGFSFHNILNAIEKLNTEIQEITTVYTQTTSNSHQVYEAINGTISFTQNFENDIYQIIDCAENQILGINNIEKQVKAIEIKLNEN